MSKPLSRHRNSRSIMAGAVSALVTLLCMAQAVHAENAAPGSAAAAPTTAATPPTVASTSAPVHPDIQRAMAYTVPQTSCVKPDPGRGTNSAGRFERLERAQKRYVKCLEGYQQQLFGDFEFLRDSVRHGATRAQADAIAANLKRVYEQIKTVQAMGGVITQDQARIITSMMSGNRAMPGAENH